MRDIARRPVLGEDLRGDAGVCVEGSEPSYWRALLRGRTFSVCSAMRRVFVEGIPKQFEQWPTLVLRAVATTVCGCRRPPLQPVNGAVGGWPVGLLQPQPAGFGEVRAFVIGHGLLVRLPHGDVEG